MENFYTYIIYNEVFDKYYKGFSTNPKQRLIQHNLGEINSLLILDLGN